MQLRNDYDKSVFNGDIGVISAIDGDEAVVRVEFDGRIASYERAELDQLTHAYAVTIHKSQGSEFAHVVLVLPDTDSALLTRELLYTGITRARSAFTLVTPDAQRLVTASARRTQRISGLRAHSAHLNRSCCGTASMIRVTCGCQPSNSAASSLTLAGMLQPSSSQPERSAKATKFSSLPPRTG